LDAPLNPSGKPVMTQEYGGVPPLAPKPAK